MVLGLKDDLKLVSNATKRNSECRSNTSRLLGETCGGEDAYWFRSCYDSHGPTICNSDKQCECPAGYCVKTDDWKCIPEYIDSTQ